MQKDRLINLALAALIAGVASVGAAMADNESRGYRPDMGKRVIERPLEKSISPELLLNPISTVPQDGLQPLRAADNRSLITAAPADRSQAKFANPRVAPGQVQWHHDYGEALASSKQSGKPVLLFQMMGKLDDKFC